MRVTVELRKHPGRTKTLFSHELTRTTRIRAGSNQPVSALSKAILFARRFQQRFQAGISKAVEHIGGSGAVVKTWRLAA